MGQHMNDYLSLSGAPTSPAHLLVRLPLFCKTVTEEYNHDFTLPDYLPEIRKMLRVTVTVLPPESYASASDVEYAGELRYHILYTGADGELHSTDLPAEYTLSVPVDPPAFCNLSMGVEAWADGTPELLVTRVLSPRKLGIRTRIAFRTRAQAWHSLEESLTGNPNGRIERRVGEADSAVILRGRTTAELVDEILPDAAFAASPIRVAGHEEQVFVSEAIPDKDRVHLRGELHLKLLLSHIQTESEEEGSAHPLTTVHRKIPFSVAVDLDGADRYCDARGFGAPADIKLTVEDGRIIADAEFILTAECQKNQRFAYTRDLYSTGAECETTVEVLPLPFALSAQNGNFTFSDTVSLENSGVSPSDRILDVCGDFGVEEVTEKNAQTVFTGTAHFHLLTENTDSGEFGFGEISLPFRYLAPSANDRTDLPAVKDHDASFVPLTIRTKRDGETLALDAEVAVSTRTAGATEIHRLTEAKFGEPERKDSGAIVLTYPAPGTALWDVAKKYRTDLLPLAERNGLDPSPDAKITARFLVVKE
ncbi:MAG: DUF3794 domain-containing protein [Clostridia bacterium]|nr:DUF3794 domain-containing protein [Clostridia bacterium]